MNLVETLIKYRRFRVAKELLALYGLEVPREVLIGDNLHVPHRGFGLVVHPKTTIGSNVTLYHGVTIGRKDSHIPFAQSKMERIVIDDGAVLFPGCVVLGGPGITRVGRGTVLAANAVLTQSTGDHEIWGGVPARMISRRTSLESGQQESSSPIP